MVNLAVRAALEVANDEIALLRHCVRAVRLSPLKLDRLKSLCEGMEPSFPFVKPILDVPTRWNSTADMIERAIRLRRPLSILFCDFQHDGSACDEFLINSSIWKKLEDFVWFLSLFEEATVMACADRHPSLSLVVPLYCSLLNHTEETMEKNDVGSCLHGAARASFEKLTKYYDISSDVCTVVTVLDPRLRLEFHRQQQFAATPQKAEHIIYALDDKKYLEDYAPLSMTTSSDNQRAFPSANRRMSEKKFKNRKVATKNEFKEYCSQACLNEDIQPLNWWRENAKVFPNPARMVRDYLAVPGTSAGSERAFSAGRHLKTDF